MYTGQVPCSFNAHWYEIPRFCYLRLFTVIADVFAYRQKCQCRNSHLFDVRLYKCILILAGVSMYM